MDAMTDDDRAFFLAPGPMTTLPPDTPVMAGADQARAAVQGILVHAYWLWAYGITDDRPAERQLRSVQAILQRAQELSDEPVGIQREPENRVQVTCRDFTVLYVALLRAAGIPARARCGFAAYFTSDTWEDHWVAERWDGKRWVRDDAQLDEVQLAALHATFDPHDLPEGQFLTGGEVWQKVRSGEIAAGTCGIGDLRGDWFVAGNVLRDAAAFTGIELLPWDSWGVLTTNEPGRPDVALYDEVAHLTGTEAVAELRERFAADPRLTIPRRVTSYVDGVPCDIDLGGKEAGRHSALARDVVAISPYTASR